jgi:hypothetical protein
MPQNPIQFQPGMSPDDFFARYRHRSPVRGGPGGGAVAAGVRLAALRSQKHKLLEAMAERGSGRLLTGVVVADDAVVGGKRRGGKRGRGAEGKAAFIAAVELDDDGHPQNVRLDPLPDLKGDTLRA